MPLVIWTRGARFDGVTINMSEGGVYFFAAADISVGDHIEVEFRPSDEKKPVRACGVVCRRALYLYGVEFAAEQAALVPGTVAESHSRDMMAFNAE